MCTVHTDEFGINIKSWSEHFTSKCRLEGTECVSKKKKEKEK